MFQGFPMSLLAIVTFDLHGAMPKDYPRVKRKLATLRLEKQMRMKGKDAATKLPANTFAAKFRGTWNHKNASHLRDHLREHIRNAIISLGLRASIFVAVGDNWAWGKTRVTK